MSPPSTGKNIAGDISVFIKPTYLCLKEEGDTSKRRLVNPMVAPLIAHPANRNTHKKTKGCNREGKIGKSKTRRGGTPPTTILVVNTARCPFL